MFNRNKRRGASLGEYGLVVGLISVLAVAAVAGVGGQVSHTFGDATATLSDRMTPPSTGGAATDRAPAFETAGDLGSFAFDQPFSAVVAAIDPEGDAISYELVSGPAWLQIGTASGALSESAPRPDVTRIDFTVTAADPGGHGVTRAFHATRRNTAPSFATTAGLGPLPYADPVSATIAASDAEGDDITYRLASGSPAWLAIDPVSGALSESAARPHLDAVAFTLVAQDSAGGSTERAFTVELDDPRSCEEIFQATSATAATGTYRIDPDGDGADPIWAQCYMVASSARPGETGGWTAAASQVEGNPAGWQDGVAGRDASYTGTRSYALSSSELPQHTVTGFGRQLPGGGFEILDAVATTYETGEIHHTPTGDGGALPSILGTGIAYDIHRQGDAFYHSHDPDSLGLEEGPRYSGPQWHQTLTFDARQDPPVEDEPESTWAFSPLNSEPAKQGFNYDGEALGGTAENFAWVVFVR